MSVGTTDDFPGFLTKPIAYFTPEQKQFCAIDFMIERSELELELARTKTEIKTCLVGIVVKWTEMAQLTMDYCQKFDVDGDTDIQRRALRLVTMVRSLGYETLSIAESSWKTIEQALEMKISNFHAMMDNLQMEEQTITSEPSDKEASVLASIFGD